MSTSNVTGMAHVCIPVQDIARSCRLYLDILGFVPDEEQVTDTMRLLLLKKGDSAIELIQHTPAREPRHTAGSIDHIAFHVRDIDDLIGKLRVAGYAFDSDEPIEVPDCFGGVKIIFFTGPDGERIELIQSL